VKEGPPKHLTPRGGAFIVTASSPCASRSSAVPPIPARPPTTHPPAKRRRRAPWQPAGERTGAMLVSPALFELASRVGRVDRRNPLAARPETRSREACASVRSRTGRPSQSSPWDAEDRILDRPRRLAWRVTAEVRATFDGYVENSYSGWSARRAGAAQTAHICEPHTIRHVASDAHELRHARLPTSGQLDRPRRPRHGAWRCNRLLPV
jgi:hypothetical protein